MKRGDRSTLMRTRRMLKVQYQTLCGISDDWDFDKNNQMIPTKDRTPEHHRLHEAIDSVSLAIQYVNRMLGLDPMS